MGLFDKKTCAVCGEKIGALSGKKLSDGNLCKACAKQLSPWFSEHKAASTEEIRAQMEARKANRAALSEFKMTKSFGEFGAILIDDAHRKFLAVADTSPSLLGERKAVTALEDVLEFNPDIIDFSQIRDVDVDIVQTQREEKQTVNGEKVSYDPRHILYMYEFAMVIRVDHPYISSMRVVLNNGAVQILNVGERLKNKIGLQIAEYLLDLPVRDVKTQAARYDNNGLKDWLLRNPYAMPDYSYGFRCSLKNWDEIQRYGYYLLMAQTVKDALLAPES